MLDEHWVMQKVWRIWHRILFIIINNNEDRRRQKNDAIMDINNYNLQKHKKRRKEKKNSSLFLQSTIIACTNRIDQWCPICANINWSPSTKISLLPRCLKNKVKYNRGTEYRKNKKNNNTPKLINLFYRFSFIFRKMESLDTDSFNEISFFPVTMWKIIHFFSISHSIFISYHSTEIKSNIPLGVYDKRWNVTVSWIVKLSL